MSALCYVNPVSDKGEVAMIAFHSEESAEVYEFFLRAYKRTCKCLPSGKLKMCINVQLHQFLLMLLIIITYMWIKQIRDTL